jgi:hypothetical protein
MPIGVPFAASPHQEPDRTRRVPESVKAACLMMIEQGVDFIVAAKANGLKPDSMRRYLNTPQVVSLIRKQRSAFRAAVCSGNEFVLQEIRDTAENSMARVRAIQVLEGLDEVASMQRPGEPGDARGIVIRVVNIVPPAAPIETPSAAPRIIDAE